MQKIELGKVNMVGTLYSMVEVEGQQLDISILKMDMLRRGVEKFIVNKEDIVGGSIKTCTEL